MGLPRWRYRLTILTVALALMAGFEGAARAGDSDGNGAALVSIVRCPNGGEAVCARITRDGAIHLLYDSRGLVWYAVSRNGGKTFDEPICAVDADSRKPGLE